MPATQSEVGNVYDVLLQTRDGSTLPCKNKDGKLVNVSQVAYCTSIDRNAQGQHEETELQHKDQLIQLGSSNLIDREFDQWPQVSQGDWSGGMLQRVLTGATPLTSFGPQSDPTKYWDGLGILWPVTDYIPQQPVIASPDQAESGAVMRFAGNGVTGGNSVFQAGNQAYAYAYMQNAAPQHNIIVLQTTGTHKIDPVPDSTNGTPMAGTLDYVLGGGFLWVVTTDNANIHINQYLDGAPPTILNTGTITGGGNGNGVQTLRVAFGKVGNKSYLAVLYLPNSLMPTIQLYDLTGSALFGSSVPIPVGEINNFSQIQQMDFLSDNLIIAGSSGSATFIEQFNIPSMTHSTLTQISNTNSVFFCPVAGGLFVLAANFTNNVTGDTVDMYLLQGGNIQHIGPVQVQATNQGASNVIIGEAEPVAYGPYAVFPIYYDPVGATTSRIAIFAFDVLRGRLFKVADVGTYERNIGVRHGRRCAIVAPAVHATPIGSLNAQWMMGVPTLSNVGSASDISNAQFVLTGVSSGSLQPFLQQGVQITSSLIDFTSAQPKLFRQAVVTWLNPGLPSDSAITVRLDVWLDQDPANLNAVPDLTTNIVATGVNGGVLGQTTLKLPINKIAKKLVYRATTTGPSTTPTAAVKLVSVVIQAATGWVQTLKLDLAPNVQTNSKNGIVWDKQSTPGSPATDHVVAYNFLRQLWRLKGGEVTATFPNGDTGDWLIQDLHFDSPKPFAASFRADQQTTYQSICSIKLREDI